MTFDGYCDHTAVNADQEMHQHYADLLKDTGTVLYGRITYQLMEYWPTVVKNPTGDKATDEFAIVIDNVEKIVYSRTLKDADIWWRNTKLRNDVVKEEVLELKNKPGKDILAGSPSLIVTLMNLDLVDEYQFMVHPSIVGKGLPLFKNIEDRIDFKLLKTKTFSSGAVIFYYEPIKK